MNLKEFFGDKKILITGASGFVGRNLYEKLKNEGLNVVGTSYSKRMDDLMFCNLTDYNSAKGVFISQRPSYVFMLATKTYGAGMGKDNPKSMVTDNVIMNAITLDLCQQFGVEKVLYISSSTVYQQGYRPLTEDDLDLNKDPDPFYLGVGWVKRYTEKLCEFYNKQYGINVVIVRPTNIYGKYDKYEEGKSHFVPAIIKRVLEGQDPLVVWGKGNSVKDLIYIDDFIRDILRVMINHNSVDPINLCSGESHPISKIVNYIVFLCLHKQIKIIYDETKPDSIAYRTIYRNKLDSLYGKAPYTSLADGLNKTIEWMRKELRL